MFFMKTWALIFTCHRKLALHLPDGSFHRGVYICKSYIILTDEKHSVDWRVNMRAGDALARLLMKADSMSVMNNVLEC